MSSEHESSGSEEPINKDPKISLEKQQKIEHSLKLKDLIFYEFGLLSKSKQPFTLIELVETYELDSKTEAFEKPLLYVLLIGYVLAGDYRSVRHVAERYSLPKQIENSADSKNQGQIVIDLAKAGEIENLQLFAELYDTAVLNVLKNELEKVIQIIIKETEDKDKLKGERSANSVRYQSMLSAVQKLDDHIFFKAKIVFMMDVLAKYYVNIDMNTLEGITGIKDIKVLTDLGYALTTDGKFIDLSNKLKQNPSLPRNPALNQEMLSKKIKHLATAANIMAGLEE